MPWEIDNVVVFLRRLLCARHKDKPIVFIRLARHLIVGGVGTLLYMAVLTGLVEVLKLEPVSSAVVAFVTMTAYTYLCNRSWVYRATRGHGYSVPRFLVVEMVGLLLNTGVMYFTVKVLGWWYLWGQLSAALVIPPTNFLLNLFWAFK